MQDVPPVTASVVDDIAPDQDPSIRPVGAGIAGRGKTEIVQEVIGHVGPRLLDAPTLRPHDHVVETSLSSQPGQNWMPAWCRPRMVLPKTTLPWLGRKSNSCGPSAGGSATPPPNHVTE